MQFAIIDISESGHDAETGVTEYTPARLFPGLVPAGHLVLRHEHNTVPYYCISV